MPVIVVVNHLRSFIDIDQDPGEGPRVRAKRKAQAESLAALLQELQTNNPTTSVISVGDYNAYQFSDGYTDPIATIKGNPTPDDQIVVDQSPDLVNPNFFNLVDEIVPGERYSFIFESTPQALDHMIVNTVAHTRNTRFAFARVNADYPEVPAATFASNAARPERNSDHDPAVGYFSLSTAQPSGSLIISEFRFRGPGPDLVEAGPVSTDIGGFGDLGGFGGFGGFGTPSSGGPASTFNAPAPNAVADTSPTANDEFIEFYNNTNSDITVSTVDGSAGWALVAADGQTRFIIPNSTVIPARGHFLVVNNLGYSLSGYRAGDDGTDPVGASGDQIFLDDGTTLDFGYSLASDNSGSRSSAGDRGFNKTARPRAGYAGVPDSTERHGFPRRLGDDEQSGVHVLPRVRPTATRRTRATTRGLPEPDTTGTPGSGLGQSSASGAGEFDQPHRTLGAHPDDAARPRR